MVTTTGAEQQDNGLWVKVEEGQNISDEEVQSALENPKDNFDAADATRSLLGFARSRHAEGEVCTELLVGGDGSKSMIQVIVAARDDQLDILATALCIDETGNPSSCFTTRGKQALTLVASYWSTYPDAPLILVSSEGVPHRVLALLHDRSWSLGQMTASHLQQLRSWSKNEPDARVAFGISPS